MNKKGYDNNHDADKVAVLRKQVQAINDIFQPNQLSLWARYDDKWEQSVTIQLYDRKPYWGQLYFEKETDIFNLVAEYSASSMKEVVKGFPDKMFEISEEIHRKLTDIENPITDTMRKSLLSRQERLACVAAMLEKEIDMKIFEPMGKKNKVQVNMKPKREGITIPTLDNEMGK